MVVELIHAAPDLTELRQVLEFDQFDASISTDADGQNDWMLEMPAKCWQLEPIYEGHYIYVSGSGWGGPVERVRHSSSDDTVRIYGTCWRGLLARRAVCPSAGETHAVYENMDANEILRNMLSGWMDGLIAVSDDQSGVVCSGRIRYRSVLEAMTGMLAGYGGDLRVSFSDGRMRVWAEPVRSRVNEIELSQEYDCSIISERSAAVYDHIIALGQGEMLERTVAELWLLPDGTTTEDSTEMGVVEPSRAQTLIYEYTAAESREVLISQAAEKLISYAGGDVMEISMDAFSSDIELGDMVAVRDQVTDILNVLKVYEMTLNISGSGITVRHRLR